MCHVTNMFLEELLRTVYIWINRWREFDGILFESYTELQSIYDLIFRAIPSPLWGEGKGEGG